MKNMKIENKMLTPGSAHGRPGTPNKPDKVVVHYVGNAGSAAINNRNWFERGGGGKYPSSHYIVGLQGEVLYTVPENEVANHAGVAYGAQWNERVKTNNRTSIGIEVCHPDASGKYSDVTRAALVWLVADVCQRYGWDETRVFRHYDVAGKPCPLYYVNNPAEWNKLVMDIGAALRTGKDDEMAKITQEEFDELMGGYLKRREVLPIHEWAVKPWDKAEKAGLLTGGEPQVFMTREQFARALDNAGWFDQS
jgi:N-acetylmuramoyl-L-alanine amidase